MKKYLVTFGLLGTLTFLVLFVYFYKTSGKFRQSVLAAFVAVAVGLLSSQPAQAGEADAFTPPNQQHQNRPQNQGFFSGKSTNDGPGPGKPNGNNSNNDDGDDGSSSKYPKRESIEETQRHLFNIDERINKLEEVTDSDSEAEEKECQEAYNQYKVYNEMSSTLSKISKRVRKDQETSKALDKLEEQLKNGEFHAGRGAKKLAGTQSVYYLRAGNQGRLFFRYSDEEKGAVEIVGESNKDKEQEVIDNLRQNYK